MLGCADAPGVLPAAADLHEWRPQGRSRPWRSSSCQGSGGNTPQTSVVGAERSACLSSRSVAVAAVAPVRPCRGGDIAAHHDTGSPVGGGRRIFTDCVRLERNGWWHSMCGGAAHRAHACSRPSLSPGPDLTQDVIVSVKWASPCSFSMKLPRALAEGYDQVLPHCGARSPTWRRIVAGIGEMRCPGQSLCARSGHPVITLESSAKREVTVLLCVGAPSATLVACRPSSEVARTGDAWRVLVRASMTPCRQLAWGL